MSFDEPRLRALVRGDRCVLRPQTYFVAWNGVLTLVYDGFPPVLAGIKARLNEEDGLPGELRLAVAEDDAGGAARRRASALVGGTDAPAGAVRGACVAAEPARACREPELRVVRPARLGIGVRAQRCGTRVGRR